MPYSGTGNFTFNVAKAAAANGNDANHWDWYTDSNAPNAGNLYVRIVMGDANVSTEMPDLPEETTVSGVFTVGTLAEFDGSGYTINPVDGSTDLPACAVAADNTNDEASITMTAPNNKITWSLLGASTDPCRALLICFSPTSTPGNGDMPVAWIETGSINGIVATGQNFTVSWPTGFAALVDG